jgi:hypothetical protein
MITSVRNALYAAGWVLVSVAFVSGQEKSLPEILQSWKDWALWDVAHLQCPTPFNSSQERLCIWPSEVKLDAKNNGGDWEVQVQVFDQSWIPLPGDKDAWPEDVKVNDQSIPVIEKDGVPAVQLLAGRHRLSGKFVWTELPERIAIPKSFGIVNLNIEGESVSIPNWDENGFVWLKRTQSTDVVEDQLTIQIYRVIEDGLPMWLRTEVDLTISGKSREEEIGNILPEGWQISFVSSPIPVALDENGQMKAQVRSGTWQISIDAFRNRDLEELRFADGVKPATDQELVGVRLRPELRTAELQGALSIDVQMTTFPASWRDLPVYEWKTDSPLKWVEKTRGMGLQQPTKLTVRRQLWLDENGTGVTYQDQIQGQPKEIARLDVAEGHELGVVRIDGTRQLITENPKSGAHGVELRTSNPNIEAIGRTNRSKTMNATGWQTEADSLGLSLTLPPGWRVYALFGADRVEGDWLTAWTLLDLFLLLIFSVAIFRLWGWWAGLVAFVAFGLSYHEPGSPRYTWLFLLIPLAILHVVRQGRILPWLHAWRFLAIAVLLLNLVPFIATQVQNALYPQLERVGVPYGGSREIFDWLKATYNASATVAEYALEERSIHAGSSMTFESKVSAGKAAVQRQSQMANMQFDAGTSIQTGMAKPEWYGNQVRCYWDGPVSRDQTIQPILISCNLHRIFTIVRLVLIGLLVAILLRGKSPTWIWFRGSSAKAVAASLAVLLGMYPAQGWSQIPSDKMLQTLRERLLVPSEAYPRAAEIPSMSLNLDEEKIVVDAEVHAAIDVAIPVPGKLPAWSPLSVKIDNESAIVVRREDGFLWTLIPKGIHQLKVDGVIDAGAEWELAFELPPRRLNVTVSAWNVTGLRPNGRPETQLFFVRKDQQVEGAAAYDQKNFRSMVVIDRQFEVGLIWKVHNAVKRLSAPGKAISLQVPLLKNERVLTSNITNNKGSIEVNLAADESEFRWESEMQVQDELALEASTSNQAVERWSLVSSPVWNVSVADLQPIYEAGQSDLMPVWHPWPGEKATLSFRKPTAVPGKLLTVQRAKHNMSLGNRQRTSHLELQVESSLGGEFPLELPEAAVVTSMSTDSRPLPVRLDNKKYVFPLQPGPQNIEINWNIDEPLHSKVEFPAVKLPTDASNISTTLNVPESRWILWVQGPTRGPAVRFWVILVTALLLAIALACHPLSPLKHYEWGLLAIGLTQVHVIAGLIVIAWFFILCWRGRTLPASINYVAFNLLQMFLVFLTFVVLAIFIFVVGAGLLGSPEMFILGNGSYRNHLNWFEPDSGAALSQPRVISISVWYYRLLMLVWALWLANALIRWLKFGWRSFTFEGSWRHAREKIVVANEVT